MTETAGAPAPPTTRRRPRTVAIGTLGALGIAAGAVLGVHAVPGGTTIVGRAIAAPSTITEPTVLGGRAHGRALGGGITSTPGTGTSASVPPATQATAAQLVGVVDITTVLGYAGGQAAGTGMVLTSGGEILTNNHVVDGATSITVTVLSTGRGYAATVVGTDPTDDVAVLRLTGASGLATVQIDQGTVAVGDPVTAVGNAGNAPGTAAAAGTVTALNQSITATDANGQNPEQLTGLIEIAADVEPGDSGGPLYDAQTEVAGMDTAASSTGGQAYAIPIAAALSVAHQIVSGAGGTAIHHGYPAFLGISVQATSGAAGAPVVGVVTDGPADRAGLAAGDVITAIGATAIGSPDDVTSTLAGYSPGDSVRVTWTDTAGQSQTATLTLATGPAD